MGTRLYVGNLSFSTTEGDLRAMFEQAGSVKDCHLVLDKFTDRSRGFAFVEMSSQAEADAAIQQLDGKEMDGRNLKVNEARPREESGGGGRGGFSRGGGGGGGGGGGRGGFSRGGDRERRY